MGTSIKVRDGLGILKFMISFTFVFIGDSENSFSLNDTEFQLICKSAN